MIESRDQTKMMLSASRQLPAAGFNLKSAINEAFSRLETGRAADILHILSIDPVLDALLEAGAGIWEKGGRVSVREHTTNVLDGFDKYPVGRELPALDGKGPLLDRNKLILTLGLHDIGKHLPPDFHLRPDAVFMCGAGIEGRDKEFQANRSLLMLHHYRDQLPFDNQQFQLVRSLIGGDPLGSFFKQVFKNNRPPTRRKDRAIDYLGEDGRLIPTKRVMERLFRRGDLSMELYQGVVNQWETKVRGGKSDAAEIEQIADSTAQKLVIEARVLGLKPAQLLLYLTNYFQLDIRAYTADTPESTPSLDYLLKRNPEARSFRDRLFVHSDQKKRFEFSSTYEAVYNVLEAAVAALSR